MNISILEIAENVNIYKYNTQLPFWSISLFHSHTLTLLNTITFSLINYWSHHIKIKKKYTYVFSPAFLLLLYFFLKPIKILKGHVVMGKIDETAKYKVYLFFLYMLSQNLFIYLLNLFASKAFHSTVNSFRGNTPARCHDWIRPMLRWLHTINLLSTFYIEGPNAVHFGQHTLRGRLKINFRNIYFTVTSIFHPLVFISELISAHCKLCWQRRKSFLPDV